MKLLTTTNILLIIVIVIGIAILTISVKSFYKEGFQTNPTLSNALSPLSQKMSCDMYSKLMTHYENNSNIPNAGVLLEEIQTYYRTNNCDTVLRNSPTDANDLFSQTATAAIEANSNLFVASNA
jgi:hypothetical protein